MVILNNGKVQKTMDFKDPKLEFLSDMSFGLDMYDVAEIKTPTEYQRITMVILNTKLNFSGIVQFWIASVV
jgi:hypothetical protein